MSPIHTLIRFPDDISISKTEPHVLHTRLFFHKNHIIWLRIVVLTFSGTVILLWYQGMVLFYKPEVFNDQMLEAPKIHFLKNFGVIKTFL